MQRSGFWAAAAALCIAVTAHAAPVNLVPNGDFQQGNTLFTSDYGFSPAGNGSEGQYTVRSDPFPWNPFFISTFDHSLGTAAGSMMVVNGSPNAGDIVWRSQSIAVDAGQLYFFEAFVNNVCCQGFNFGPGSESILEFSLMLDGGAPNVLGTIATNLALAGTWEGLSTSFTPGTSGDVVLSLINRNTNRGGNDFAIDDVFFGTQSIVNPPSIPEPATLALLGFGMLGLGAARRR
jgi:hypothetical protein